YIPGDMCILQRLPPEPLEYLVPRRPRCLLLLLLFPVGFDRIVETGGQLQTQFDTTANDVEKHGTVEIVNLQLSVNEPVCEKTVVFHLLQLLVHTVIVPQKPVVNLLEGVVTCGDQ